MIEKTRMLALFRKKASMEAWAPLLAEFPDEVTVLTGENFEPALTLDFVPKVALISGELYPHPHDELVRKLNATYPEMNAIVLVPSNAPHIPLRSLLMDKVRHLAVADSLEGLDRIRTLIRTLSQGKNWELMSYVRPGADYCEFRLREVAGKEEVLSKIESMISGSAHDLQVLQQSAALLADEMIENAFQAAPLNAKKQDAVTIRAGFDGETLALQVVDAWGALTPEKALEFLAKHQEGQVTIDSPRGRGFLILWQFFDHFHININPGRGTAIGGKLHRNSQLSPYRLKGFDFFDAPSPLQ